MDEIEQQNIPESVPETAPDTQQLLREQAQLREQLQSLRREWEGFLAGTAVHGDATPQPGGSPDSVYTAAQLRGMSAQQINLHWDDIRRSMAGGNR